MWQEIERLRGAERLTVLLTTHYLEEADRLASKLAIVDAGRVVAEGTPDELKGELRGDSIHVELADGAEDGARSALEGVAGRARGDAGRPHAARARRARRPRRAARAAGARGARRSRPSRSRSSRPSLDDVYLRYTGRAFAEADEEMARR